LAASFTHQLQGSTPTTLEATDKLFFAGGAFTTKITVDAYNSSTHAKTDADADKSVDNVPVNVKYIAAGTADWGDGTENLDQIENAECTLKIVFDGDSGNINTEDGILFAYNGSSTPTAPTGMTVFAAQKGNANWTEIMGSASPLTLGDGTPAASTHTFYVATSAKPTAVGTKTGKYFIELSYF
jgi:hypothetical protein